MVFKKLLSTLSIENLPEIIDKAMDPVMVVFSKLVIENNSFKEVIRSCFDKFEYNHDLY